MIVLNTNVLSEPLRSSPEPRVVEWLNRQHRSTLCITAITLAELRHGVAALPDGRRKDVLGQRLEAEVLPRFANRVLPFDDVAAEVYATVQATARAQGRPMPLADALIAAIVRSRGHVLATRNSADFRSAGIQLIDPWS